MRSGRKRDFKAEYKAKKDRLEGHLQHDVQVEPFGEVLGDPTDQVPSISQISPKSNI